MAPKRVVVAVAFAALQVAALGIVASATDDLETSFGTATLIYVALLLALTLGALGLTRDAVAALCVAVVSVIAFGAFSRGSTTGWGGLWAANVVLFALFEAAVVAAGAATAWLVRRRRQR